MGSTYDVRTRDGEVIGSFRTAGGLAAWLSTQGADGVFPRYQGGRIPCVDRRNVEFPSDEEWERDFEDAARMLIAHGYYRSGKSTPSKAW